MNTCTTGWCTAPPNLPPTTYLPCCPAATYIHTTQAPSLSDLWARRWNLTISTVLRHMVFDPIIEGGHVCMVIERLQHQLRPMGSTRFFMKTDVCVYKNNGNPLIHPHACMHSGRLIPDQSRPQVQAHAATAATAVCATAIAGTRSLVPAASHSSRALSNICKTTADTSADTSAADAKGSPARHYQQGGGKMMQARQFEAPRASPAPTTTFTAATAYADLAPAGSCCDDESDVDSLARASSSISRSSSASFNTNSSRSSRATNNNCYHSNNIDSSSAGGVQLTGSKVDAEGEVHKPQGSAHHSKPRPSILRR